jgi:ATP-binding cassette subfamily B protein
MRSRLAALGVSEQQSDQLLATAFADEGWFPIAALDASIRLATSIHDGGGLSAGAEAARLVETLFDQTCNSPDDIYTLIAPDYWNVEPDPCSAELGERRLLLRGAVMVRVLGRRDGARPADAAALSPELAAALREKPQKALYALWRLLGSDGVLAPAALVGALCIAASAVLVEALLFRGLFDLGSLLNLGSQRMAGVVALLAFMALLLAFRLPIASESMRFGRRLDARLRMALLSKLPRLTDRYFQSRPVSDMAERAHSLHLLRAVPALGIQSVQTICELALTLGGMAMIDGAAALMACGVVAVAIVIPSLFQPMINEADLRVRSHSSALNGVHLDALLGIVPIRVHRAQQAVRRLHESLLVEWSGSMSRFARTSILVDGLQQVACLSLAGLLLTLHFTRSDGVSGGDLLLVYWTLKLPAIGHSLISLAHQYPAQRNILLRLLEPLSAPEEPRSAAASSPPATRRSGAVRIEITDGHVVASGHRILSGVDLTIRPGEHVAVVGPSGAGKSSLLGLLLGWHRLASGRITVDGADLTAVELEALRPRTAWVDPGIQLWNRPFLDNLAFSNPQASLARVGVVIEAAHLRGVLQRLPGGLQAPLGEGGAAISGGEGQRLRLGRALMQSRPDLVLLDEPFRGMDRMQRGQLLADVRHYWGAATLLCVSHDIEETLAFDRVLVVEDGSIVEDGRPSVLADTTSRYRNLLDAETRARDALWQGRQWRHMRMEDGHVVGVN